MRISGVVGRWLGMAALVAAASGGVFGAEPPAAAKPTFHVETLADGVYGLIRDDLPGFLVNSNVLVVVNEEDVLVVDANYTPASAEASIAAIRKLTPKPVRYVVETHWHTDHSSGAQAYVAAFPGVEIVAHPFTRDALVSRGAETAKQWAEGFPGLGQQLRDAIASGKSFTGADLTPEERAAYASDAAIADDFSAGAAAIRVVAPTLTVEDRLVLHRGERTIEIRRLGDSHTKGDLAVWLPKEGIVATGDMVVAPIPLIGADQSQVVAWPRTLDALLALQPKTIVPGHGPVLHDDAYVRLFRDFLDAAVAAGRQAIARGDGLEQAKKAIRLDDFRARMAGTNAELRFLFSVYGIGPTLGALYRDEGPPPPPAAPAPH